MKARVYVSMKPTVLDPQGQTICSALNSLGHREILVRTAGQVLRIGIRRSEFRGQSQPLRISRRSLAMFCRIGVIEDYRVEILDGIGQHPLN